jgi:hypothetical protein
MAPLDEDGVDPVDGAPLSYAATEATVAGSLRPDTAMST